MKNKYVNLITFAALFCILFLQGIWLYNTYKLLDMEFKKKASQVLINSSIEELQLRIDDPIRKKRAKGREYVLNDFRLRNDLLTNSREMQDYLYLFDKDFPISLEKVDSIFRENIKKDYGRLNYSLLLTDSLNNQVAVLNQGQKSFNNRFTYRKTIQLRNVAPEYITLNISSPYIIVFEKMALMLLASFGLALIVVYGLILQVRIINLQNTIAEIRQNFTHSMIHNMKNPVSTIIVGISTLKSGKLDVDPAMKEKFYSIVTQEGEHILKIANKILEIAKFEEGQSMLSMQQINLSNILEKLKTKYLIDTRKKVNFNIESNGVENIYADSYFISEAFDDLIDNAIKYSKKDEDVEINITSSYSEKDVQIIFRDNGIGISKNDQEIIFKKYERSMSVIKNQSKTTGFGLGLNYVYQVISAHKGTIKVNSRLGSFSEFIINLPHR